MARGGWERVAHADVFAALPVCLIWQCVCAKNRPLLTQHNPYNETNTNNEYIRLSLFLLEHHTK